MEDELEKVLNCLRSIRIDILPQEYNLQELIAVQLNKAGIAYKKEYKLAPGNRIDFLAGEGIGIEAKKGKPNRRVTIRQLERYAASGEVKVLILVVERNLSIPEIICGKYCISYGLNRNWGIAL